MADERNARAQEEVERALREMVKLPPATVEVVFEGIDSTRYTLVEGTFTLDDRPIPFQKGSKVLFSGEIEPGKHHLSTTLVYEAPSPIHGSIKYKVPGKFIFTAQRGVLMRVRARIEVDDGAEPSKRLQLLGEAETDLRAKLEDALPPPPDRSHAGPDVPAPAKQPAVGPAVATANERREAAKTTVVQAAAPELNERRVQPAVAKRVGARGKARGGVAQMAHAAATAAAEAPSASPESPAAEEQAAQTSPPEPAAVPERSAPAPSTASAGEPPAPAKGAAAPADAYEPPAVSSLRRFGTVLGSGIALLGLLLLAVSRKKR